MQLSLNVGNNSIKPKFGMTACCLLKEMFEKHKTYYTISLACIVGIGVNKDVEGSGSGAGGSSEGGSGASGGGSGAGGSGASGSGAGGGGSGAGELQ